MDGSTKHIRVAYLYIGKERGFFTEGIDLKLVLVPAYLAGTALIARQLDSMEFGSTGTIAGTGIQRLVDRGMGLDKQMLHPAMHRPLWPVEAAIAETQRAVCIGHNGVVASTVPMELRVPHINDAAYDAIARSLDGLSERAQHRIFAKNGQVVWLGNLAALHLLLSLSSANKKPGWRNRVRAIAWNHGCARSTQFRESNR